MVVTAGETVKEEPVPMGVPAQSPENQYQFAPSPSNPPVTESVVLCPGHRREADGVIPDGVRDESRTVIVPLAAAVIPQGPSART